MHEEAMRHFQKKQAKAERSSLGGEVTEERRSKRNHKPGHHGTSRRKTFCCDMKGFGPGQTTNVFFMCIRATAVRAFMWYQHW